jgi:hypothetical protein
MSPTGTGEGLKCSITWCLAQYSLGKTMPSEVDCITGTEFLVWTTKAPLTLDNQKTSLGYFGSIRSIARHIGVYAKGAFVNAISRFHGAATNNLQATTPNK